MEISSFALDTVWKTVHMKKTKVGFNQECPESHSFAFDWVNFSNFKMAKASPQTSLKRAENAVKRTEKETSLLMVLETGYVSNIEIENIF